jgi:hypothetical protein
MLALVARRSTVRWSSRCRLRSPSSSASCGPRAAGPC